MSGFGNEFSSCHPDYPDALPSGQVIMTHHVIIISSDPPFCATEQPTEMRIWIIC